MSDNPYAPPKSAVEDPVTVSLAPVDRPHSVRLATRLLWFGIALGSVNGVLLAASTANVRSLPIGLVVVGLLALLTYNISRGRNWARVTLLVIFVIGLPGSLFTLRVLLQQSVLAAAVSVVISMVQMVALFLVFTRDGRRWFRRGKLPSEAVA